ncbi:MAG: stage sporulation protein [Clostridiales bacterium]|nr:stage sporulation protein [Clostridiales bacterium]
MNGDIIYIKAEQTVLVTNKKIYLEDVVKLYGENKTLIKELNRQLFMTEDTKEKDIMVSILKVMETIHKVSHGAWLINIGEADFIINYRISKPERRYVEYAKVIFITLTASIGAAFSIMTFNTDISVGELFQRIYVLVLGRNGTELHFLEAGYAIGLTSGILLFYNHLTKKHMRDDPTPIDIEMRKFEIDKATAKIKSASREGTTIDAD